MKKAGKNNNPTNGLFLASTAAGFILTSSAKSLAYYAGHVTVGSVAIGFAVTPVAIVSLVSVVGFSLYAVVC